MIAVAQSLKLFQIGPILRYRLSRIMTKLRFQVLGSVVLANTGSTQSQDRTGPGCRRGLHPGQIEDLDQVITKVFIAGSPQFTRLPADVKSRVDTMNEKGLQSTFSGEAGGTDKGRPVVPRQGQHSRTGLVHYTLKHCSSDD